MYANGLRVVQVRVTMKREEVDIHKWKRVDGEDRNIVCTLGRTEEKQGRLSR